MPIISTVGLFCGHKFEETPNEKVVNMSKLTKSYFRGNFKKTELSLRYAHICFVKLRIDDQMGE